MPRSTRRSAGKRARTARRKGAAAKRVRLKPADSFELIRWLARSQNDPRKAVAELVQNSLDAGARHVEITRRRMRGVPVLEVRDDGEGVIPEMAREEALRYLATHVGHSRKLGLGPAERAERVVAGKYGVGILGFWSLGKELELRSRVHGSELMALTLTEDKPHATIERIPTPLDAPSTFTEVVVRDLHDVTRRVLVGRRLCDYLAAELRGQLLAREVELRIHDRQARGTAQKHFRVVPRRFVGEALALPAQIEVDGQAPARVELYAAAGTESPCVQVASAGTLVADDIGQLGALPLDHAPWVGCGLSGIIDYPDFRIPPGSRRGVSLDEAADRFVAALESLRPAVEAELARFEAERLAAADRDVVKELRKALKGFHRRLPHYALPGVQTQAGGEGADVAPGAVVGNGDGVVTSPTAPLELFPPGPLASLRLVPQELKIPPGGERRVRAVAFDAEARRIRQGLELTWSIEGSGLSIRGGGLGVAICAAPDTPVHDAGVVRAVAVQDARRAEASARVVVTDDVEDPGRDLGIPEPELVDDLGGAWRSRLQGERWQVNAAHEDYVSLQSESRARVRYFLLLIAKEMVNRSYGRPGDDTLLERVVEVLAHAERNMRGR